MAHALGIETNARVIPATSGHHWRSAAPDALDSDGWATLIAAGVTTVVDLRNESEIPAERSLPESVTVINAPLEDPEDADYTALWDRNWAHPDFYLWGVGHWPRLWSTALTAIAEAPGNVLVHCAGGRDRTGLIVAVLLDRSGIDRALVLDDYEAGLRGGNAMLAARGETGHSAEIPPVRLEGVVTRLRTALDNVLNQMPAAIDNAGLADVAERAARRLTV
jgi:hypothetical protein